MPTGFELVYDAYNALSICFSASEKLGGGFAAVVVYPRHVNLAFNRGVDLPDPEGLLQGTGAAIRHVRVANPAPRNPGAPIQALLAAAVRGSGLSLDEGEPRRLVVKAIYERQRARTPGR